VRASDGAVIFRPLVAADQALLWELLHVALWDPPPAPLRPREILQSPHVRIYAENWGASTDVGVVAQAAPGGAPLGGCWMRLVKNGQGLGYVDDATLAALFRRAEVIAYPSLVEGFGMPALEALASGTPLVTTSGSALEEIVGDAALLVPPADTAALARALASVLDDPALAARLRTEGPPRAATFTWERSIAAHVGAYERAIRHHAAGATVPG